MKKLCKHVFIAALRFVALEHDMIADELFHKKSISALIWLISQGRELEAAGTIIGSLATRTSGIIGT